MALSLCLLLAVILIRTAVPLFLSRSLSVGFSLSVLLSHSLCLSLSVLLSHPLCFSLSVLLSRSLCFSLSVLLSHFFSVSRSPTLSLDLVHRCLLDQVKALYEWKWPDAPEPMDMIFPVWEGPVFVVMLLG